MEIAVRENLSSICDPDMLKVAVRLSKEAYKKRIFMPDDFPHGFKKFHAWYSSATAFLCRGETYDALVFRGTKEKMDFLIDAMAIPVYYGNTWCHSGFAYSHWSIWKKIKKAIDPDKPLLVTGHSLGGGNADKTCDFLVGHKPGVHMITFGKPNVHLKNQSPYRGHLLTHLSVVSGSDLVTRLPRLFYGAHAEQNMLYLANTGINYINPAPGFVRNDFGIADSLSDHSIDGVYKVRVDGLLAGG